MIPWESYVGFRLEKSVRVVLTGSGSGPGEQRGTRGIHRERTEGEGGNGVTPDKRSH